MLEEIIAVLVKQHTFFLQLFFEHVQISLSAFTLAVLVGGFFGIAISEYTKAARPTLGIVNFLYTIPSISMLGFLIPFSGIGNVTAIIALTIYALLPMVRNTYTGINELDATIIEAAKAMGSTRLQLLYKIKLPLAFPHIFSGIRNMMTMTIALAGIASFIGAGGLGVAIYRGITTNNTAMTLIGSLLIAFLALGVDALMGMLERCIKAKKQNVRKKLLGLGLLFLALLASLGGMHFMQAQSTKTLHIASKPMTEQYILSEMLAMLIEHESNIQVKITQGVGGGTANIHPAMEQGEFDMYMEYTGTGWNMILKKESLYTEDLFPELQKHYTSKHNMQWLGMFGFNNTFGIAVRKDIATRYNIKTYSDLKAISTQLTFGAEYDFFGREDGFDMLCKVYDLQFADTIDMDIGLKYQAINEGKIDVMNIFTTDGQLSMADVVVLEDDRHMYPSYKCGNIVRHDVLEKHPELHDILSLLQGRISDKAIAHMNYQVESLGKDPKEVAKIFLQQQGLLP